MLGIGTIINHYYYKRLDAKLCDTSAMIITISSLILLMLHKFQNVYSIYSGMLTVFVTYICLWLSVCLNEELEFYYLVFYTFMILYLIYLLLKIDYRNTNIHKGIFYIIVGIIFWKIDLSYYKELGNYGFLLNGYFIYPNLHILWHIFSAISLYYCCISIDKINIKNY